MIAGIDPESVFRRIHQDLPVGLHTHVTIIGSLAAAYHFRARLGFRPVKTKDADLMVQPAGALERCRDIAVRLLDGGWTPIADCIPGSVDTPTEDLPVVRLHPPGSQLYFLELTGLAPATQQDGVAWERFEARGGWYALPSFRYLRLVGSRLERATVGLNYASPSMMALANALSHPTLDGQLMSKPVEGRKIKRAAKDLGRVLAIAYLAGREETEEWLPRWQDGLWTHFSDDAAPLGRRAGAGIRALLESRAELADAHWTTTNGLLGGLGVTEENLRAVGERLLVDLFGPLAQEFSQ